MDRITFRALHASECDRIFQFLCDNFFPDAPILRSVGIAGGEDKSWFAWLIRPIFLKLLRKKFVDEVLPDANSIVAESEEDGQVVGLRLGRIIDKSNLPPKHHETSFTDSLIEGGYGKLLGSVLPLCLYKMLYVLRLLRQLRSDPRSAVEDVGCERLYYGEVLVTRRSNRTRGLGSELARRSLELAREKECDGYFVFATGGFSQKAFRKLGLSEVRSVEYAECRDDFGRPVVDRAAPHTHGKTMMLRM